MKVLLDENLPHDFRHFLAGHEAVTAVVVLRAKSNAPDDLWPLVPRLLQALTALPPRAAVRVE